MTELENKSILSGIYFERYKNGIQEQVLQRIMDAVKKVKSELAETDGVYTKQRYKEILKALKNISSELAENIGNEIDVEGVISYELEKQSKLLREYGNIADLVLPTTKQILTAVTFKPFISKTFESFLNEIDIRFFTMWDAEVRNGYLTGMTTDKIIRSVVGKMARSAQIGEAGKLNPFINSVTANTRTALQSFANETRRAVFKENEKLFSGYKWVATLDRRTCLVCGEWDGRVQKLLDKFPDIPMHINCRCLCVPIVKGIDDDFTAERVSENGLVDGKITYKEWLKKQDDEILKDILGKTRFEYYQKNKADLNTFIADNRILTLDELRRKL